MSSLEQSLDAIIASNKKPAPKKKAVKPVKKAVKPTRVGKAAAGKTAKKPIVIAKPAPSPASAVDYASKVVVYGLPKDIKNDAVKVGGVKTVSLSYNEKGQSKGIATVIFQKSKQAQKAVESYNGAPIDGGKTTLRLELIVNPALKPLASRIVPNRVSVPTKKASPAKATVKGAKAKPAKAAKPAPKKTKPAKKAAPKKKKTIEELDQEMADYFSTNDKQ